MKSEVKAVLDDYLKRCKNCDYCEPHMLETTAGRTKVYICELQDGDGYYKVVDPDAIKSCDNFKEEMSDEQQI